MSYEMAMRAAGAEVIQFQEFGDYQGNWWAKVNFEGKAGWVNGSYGSCSGCDAFQAEFDTMGHYHGDEYGYTEETKDFFDPACEKCVDFRARLISFGRTYLDNLMAQEEAEKEVSQHLEWDSDAREALEWLKTNHL